MKAEEIKIELISWIASLKQKEWLNNLLELKNRLENEGGSTKAEKIRAKKLRGYGKYAGKIMISDDFDEPLADFKEYM
ncbi:MAG: DUF2281 domain-containing protein [Bacteroidota bacterium]